MWTATYSTCFKTVHPRVTSTRLISSRTTSPSSKTRLVLKSHMLTPIHLLAFRRRRTNCRKLKSLAAANNLYLPSVCSIYLFDLFVRLERQLLQTTWSQTELKIWDDLRKLQEWSRQFSVFASQQAGCENT